MDRRLIKRLGKTSLESIGPVVLRRLSTCSKTYPLEKIKKRPHSGITGGLKLSQDRGGSIRRSYVNKSSHFHPSSITTTINNHGCYFVKYFNQDLDQKFSS